MRCIFCKAASDAALSVEHIVPESMGNVNHVLPKGAVCDSCNQYFARSVERPLLESALFRHIRAGMAIHNKRGRLPKWAATEGIARPSYRQMGRFLAKVGVEALAFKTLHVSGWNEEIVEKRELDDIRAFARRDAGDDWPFTTRRLHPINTVFEEQGSRYHLLHEFDVLLTNRDELYLALSLYGVELVLNLGGRTLDGYREWLREHNYASPLYVRQNA